QDETNLLAFCPPVQDCCGSGGLMSWRVSAAQTRRAISCVRNVRLPLASLGQAGGPVTVRLKPDTTYESKLQQPRNGWCPRARGAGTSAVRKCVAPPAAAHAFESRRPAS